MRAACGIGRARQTRPPRLMGRPNWRKSSGFERNHPTLPPDEWFAKCRMRRGRSRQMKRRSPCLCQLPGHGWLSTGCTCQQTIKCGYARAGQTGNIDGWKHLRLTIVHSWIGLRCWPLRSAHTGSTPRAFYNTAAKPRRTLPGPWVVNKPQK